MQFLFDIVIGSLIFVYDLLFTLINRSFTNPVISIIVLSIAINFFVLPLYSKADALQKEEQEKKQSMAFREKQIRSNFKKDEQFMMLSAYYRICHYNPLSFIKEAIPLLLQIPFFIAAYQFISSLPVLDGVAWGPINNLIEPDRMIVIGSCSINILPIIMTVINLVAGAIYSKDSSMKLKVQIIITALIFLALLYNSPSGLVLYWTMNNVFSLVKNVVMTLSEKGRMVVKAIIAFAILAVTEVLSIMLRIQTEPAEIIVIGSITYILVTLGHDKIRDYVNAHFPFILKLTPVSSKSVFTLFFLSAIGLAIMLGLYIPSTVIVSSVVEFINPSNGLFNYDLISYTASIYVGLLLLWLTVIYFSYGRKGRLCLSIALSTMLLFSIINQFVFDKRFGTLYADLQFEEYVHFSRFLSIINIVAGLLILITCIIVLMKKAAILRYFTTILIISLLILSGRNLYLINNEARALENEFTFESSYDGILRLSRTGKNVIVFMLDRAIGGYIPYIFDEKPELLDSFRGFVYYPNTISFGTHTNFGAPALFGGYEYTPAAINQRPNESLEDKHDQALLLMPVLFSQDGYDVTVTDPPYAGYQSPPDLSIYDDYPQVNAYSLCGRFSDEFIYNTGNVDSNSIQKHNMIMYSAFRTAPVVLRTFIYDDGYYIRDSLNVYYSGTFIDSYSTLAMLTRLTSIDDSDHGSFLLLQNETPHNPTYLIPPDYDVGVTPFMSIPEESEFYVNRTLDNRTLEISGFLQWRHYCVNVATYEQIAIWLDYLKDQGIYDNTRIILVADHGYYLSQFPDLITLDGLDIESFNPLLMVKDFDSTGPFTTDYTFMTNADVPTLAMSGIIDNPINPFTGNPVNNDRKFDGPLFVTDSNNWEIGINNGNVYDLGGGNWWSVRDNIFDLNNWSLATDEEVY